MADLSMGAQAGGAGRAINLLGGALSLALVIGAGVWGTKLVLRDVSGVPLVRALEGPIRVPPEEPGGQVSHNAGLAVNEVAAQGLAAPVNVSLGLAADAPGLAPEDLNPAPLVTEAAQPVAAPSDDVQALVDEILANADAPPLAPVEEAEDQVTIMVNGAPVQTRRAGSALAVARAIRPAGRPAGWAPQAGAVPTGAVEAALRAATAAPQVVEASAIAPGTQMVQLGAYESAAVAQSEWDRLSARFADYMRGKTQVILRAKSGGKTFYRLRVSGFDDQGDARRFCSALTAGRAECIPVLGAR